MFAGSPWWKSVDHHLPDGFVGFREPSPRRRQRSFSDATTILVAIGFLAVSPSWARSDDRDPAPTTTGRRPPNVLLITADTLRPDALGWVSGVSWTPHLDRLAAQSARFPAAISPAPLTLPAHASILSGLVPRRLGIHDNGQVLGAGVDLLSERLAAAGYATGAFVSGYPLQAMFGLARGFERYDDQLTTGEGAWLERPAAETTAAALAWIDTAPQPWFVWIHYYDPHLPYTPPPGMMQPGRRGAYDGEVAGMDAAIGDLLAGLDRQTPGPDRQPHANARQAQAGGPSAPVIDSPAQEPGRSPVASRLTIFAGDHGESLGEHGEGSHGYFIYDSTMLVPMLWHFPGRLTPGDNAAAVRLVDVAPTVLDLLGLDPLTGVDGVSLAPALGGRRQEIPAAYLESWQPWTSYGWSPLRAIRHDQWKLIAAPRPELYDLAADPGETDNLVTRERQRARQLEELLEAAEEATAGVSQTVDDPETMARLSALGYLGSGRSRAQPTGGLADPKDRVAVRRLLTEADAHLRRGELRPALTLFDRVLADEPDNRFAVSRSGEALLRSGDVQGAIVRLEQAARLDPDSPEIRALLAEALMRGGRFADAADQWQELVRLQPGRAAGWSNLGAALGRAGRVDAAIEALAHAVELSPDDASRLTRLAFAEHAGGRHPEAASHLGQAAALSGGDFTHAGALGLILLRADQPTEAHTWLSRCRATEPEFVEARIALARLDLEAGNSDAATAALEPLLEARPEVRSRLAADPQLAPLLPSD